MEEERKRWIKKMRGHIESSDGNRGVMAKAMKRGNSFIFYFFTQVGVYYHTTVMIASHYDTILVWR